MKKNTVVVNLFGGQGTGKSTLMCGIFARLKSLGYDCEIYDDLIPWRRPIGC